MKHRLAGLIASGVCIAIVMGLSNTAWAFPSPIETKTAEAARLQKEVQASAEKILVLAERDGDARLRLEDTTKRIVHIAANIAVTRAESGARLGWSDVLSVRDDLRSALRSLEAAQKDALNEIDAIGASRRSVEAAYARKAQLLAQVRGEMATLVEQEQEAAAAKVRSDAALAQMRREMQFAGAVRGWVRARARAAADVLVPGPAGVDPSNVPIPNVPAMSPGASAAVAYAKAQLGRPYRYAGVGPDAYDCSGLTMMAWAEGGVLMPHGSMAQGDMFPRVPESSMEPGDLVIYYPDHHHVGMYVGGGMTISATHTGDYVRLQPVFRSGFQFAVRPGIGV
jgi:cell wall-associated NlpC family hydrolase